MAADPKANPNKIGWQLRCDRSDNVATQIDSLGLSRRCGQPLVHGFKEADWGGNFGIRKCDATTIPPIITRGVMIDVAGLPTWSPAVELRDHADDLKAALETENDAPAGDTVLIRPAP